MLNSSSINDLTLYEMHQYRTNGQAVVVYLSFLLIIGIVGNIHALLVYGWMKKTSNYQIFIIVLALNDLLACIFSIPFEIVTIRFKYTYGNAGACKIFRFFYYMFILSSGLLLSLTAVERFQRIYYPFRTQMTRRVIYVACGAVFGASFLSSLPILVFYDIVPKEMIETPFVNGTKCGVLSYTFKSIHFIFLLLISTSILIVVVVAYSVIAKVIFRQRQYVNKILSSQNCSISERNHGTNVFDGKRLENELPSTNSLDSRSSRLDKINISARTSLSSISNMNRRRGSQRSKNNTIAIRNTITLMLVSLVSYVGILPIIILGIIKTADGNSYEEIEAALGTAGSNILIRGYFINNVVNPFVYLCTDKQFKDGIRQIYLTIWTNLKCKRLDLNV